MKNLREWTDNIVFYRVSKGDTGEWKNWPTSKRATISLVARRSVCLFEETRLVFHAYFRNRYFCRCSLRRCYEPRSPASSPRLLINLFPTSRNAKQNGMTEAKAEKGERSRATRSQRRGKITMGLRIRDEGEEMERAGRNKNTGVPPSFPISFFLSRSSYSPVSETIRPHAKTRGVKPT